MPRDNDGTKPERHGHVWKEEEEKYVLGRIEKKVPIHFIANEIKRTSTGVYSHLKEIAVKNINNGMLIEEASELTSVSITEIQDYLAKKEIISKIKANKGLIQKKFEIPDKKEEDLLSVVIEIRNLLLQLVKKDIKSEDEEDDAVTTDSSNSFKTLDLR